MKSNHLGLTIALTSIIFILSLYLHNIPSIESKTEIQGIDLVNGSDLRTSTTSGKIHIDNNWTEVKSAGICKGNGTFSEPYLIEDKVIDGKGRKTCILIRNSNAYFKINNCTLFSSYEGGIELYNVSNSFINASLFYWNYYGVLFSECINNTIFGSNLRNNVYGIYLSQSYATHIFNNNLSNNHYGVHFDESHFNELTENVVSELYLYESNYNLFYKNNVSGNGYGIYLLRSYRNNFSINNVNIINNYGIYLLQSDRNNFSRNYINSINDYGIYLYSSDYNTFTVNKINGAYGMYLGLSHHNTISANTVNGDYGMYFHHCDYNVVSGNLANGNNYGIYLRSCSHNIVSENIANSNDYGIYLHYSHSNNVSGNTANNNKYRGISLTSCFGNIILSNNASYNLQSGISLSDSCYLNVISGNTVRDNLFHGIYLQQGHDNIIEGNFVLDNDVGIYIEYILGFKNEFKEPENDISNNNFSGNDQEFRKVILYSFDAIIFILVTLLSVVTCVTTIGTLTAEIIKSRKYFREEKGYEVPKFGISALLSESVGATIFLLATIFLFGLAIIEIWLFSLINFAIVGISLSKKGLRKEIRTFVAKVGLGFGLTSLILSILLIMSTIPFWLILRFVHMV